VDRRVIETPVMHDRGSVPIASSINLACFGTKHFRFNYGLATTPLVIGAILGPCLGGYLHTETGIYYFAIVTSAALPLLAIITGIISRAQVRKASGRRWPSPIRLNAIEGSIFAQQRSSS
jgi:MFS family permease